MKVSFEIEINQQFYEIKVDSNETGQILSNNVSSYFEVENEVVVNILVKEIPDQMTQRWIVFDKTISEQIPNHMLTRCLKAETCLSYLPNEFNPSRMSKKGLNFTYWLVKIAVITGQLVLSFDEFCDVIGYAICADDNLFEKTKLTSYIPKKLFSSSYLTTDEWEDKLTDVCDETDCDKSSDEYKFEFIERIQQMCSLPKLLVFINDSVIKSIMIDESGFRVLDRSMEPPWENIDEDDIVTCNYKEGELFVKTSDYNEMRISLKNPEDVVVVQNVLNEYRNLNYYNNLTEICQINDSTYQNSISKSIYSSSTESKLSTTSDMDQVVSPITLDVNFNESTARLLVNKDHKVIDILKMLSQKINLNEYWFYGLQCNNNTKPLYSEQTISSQIKSTNELECNVVFYCLPNTTNISDETKLNLYNRIVELILEDKFKLNKIQSLKIAAISRMIDSNSINTINLEKKFIDPEKYYLFERFHQKLVNKKFSKDYYVDYFLRTARNNDTYGLFKFLKVDFNENKNMILMCNPEKMKFIDNDTTATIYYKDCSDLSLNGNQITFYCNNEMNTIEKTGDVILYIYDVISNYTRAYNNSIDNTDKFDTISFSEEELRITSSTMDTRDTTKSKKSSKKEMRCEFDYNGQLYQIEISKNKMAFILIGEVCALIGFNYGMFINIEYYCPIDNKYIFLLKHKKLKKQSIIYCEDIIKIYLKYYLFPHTVKRIPPIQYNLCYQTLKNKFVDEFRFSDIQFISNIIGLALFIDYGIYYDNIKYEYQNYVPSEILNDYDWKDIFIQQHQKVSKSINNKDKAIKKYIQSLLNIEQFVNKDIKANRFNKNPVNQMSIGPNGLKVDNSETIPHIKMKISSFKKLSIYVPMDKTYSSMNKIKKLRIEFSTVKDRRRAYDYLLHYYYISGLEIDSEISTTSVVEINQPYYELKPKREKSPQIRIPENTIEEKDNRDIMVTSRIPENTIEEKDNCDIMVTSRIPKNEIKEEDNRDIMVTSRIPEKEIEEEYDLDRSSEDETTDSDVSEIVKEIEQKLYDEEEAYIEDEVMQTKENSVLDEMEEKEVCCDVNKLRANYLLNKYMLIKNNLNIFKSQFLTIMLHTDKEMENLIFTLIRRMWSVVNQLDAIHYIYKKYDNLSILIGDESVQLHDSGYEMTQQYLIQLNSIIEKLGMGNNSTVKNVSKEYVSTAFTNLRVN